MRRRAAKCFASVSSFLADKPWTHWAVAFATLQLFFFVDRFVALDALIAMYGNDSDEHSAGVKAAVVAFGMLEDAVCAAYFVLLLWIADVALRLLSLGPKRYILLIKLLRFVWYLAAFLVFATPFAADMLLVRLRQFRFTSDLVAMALSEKDVASAAVITPEEMHEGYVTVAVTVAIGVAFALVGALWLDLRAWNPFTRIVRGRRTSSWTTSDGLSPPTTPGDSGVTQSNCVAEEGMSERVEKGERGFTSIDTPRRSGSGLLSVRELEEQRTCCKSTLTSVVARLKLAWENINWCRAVVYVICAAFCLLSVPFVVRAIATHSLSPLVANAALNTTLNELFGALFAVSFLPNLVDGSIASAALYLDADTETFKLAQNASLLRQTLGFRGDLAFNVSVDASDLPNVLMLVVESFRYHDSQYLVANNSYLLDGLNLTVTPQFDRWAKRGVAFYNLWSSWRTSRSVESILFAQLPFDSVTDSGTTGGRAGVELSGMPQLFAAKGYSTKFTTGCILGYDGWDSFFGLHGFDEVLGNDDFRKRAETELGIDPNDWKLVEQGGKARAMRTWGVHDDVALQVLGNLLLNETAAQRERVARGESKRPVFVNHYTISSHTPFKDRPQWYDEMDKPDFSALYEGLEFAQDVQNYLEMRFFTDIAIGKFLDRMDAEGVLNDTVVVIVGDHGQGPEYGLDVPESREVSATRVAGALIAEGRLGDSAGMLFTDVAEQYDLLNTLADIVGVPDGGFVQHGVGRSLKRKYQSEKARVVYSNNPSRKMAVVRSSERLQYDATSSAMALHNVETDHDLAHDLFPGLNASAKAEWRALRDQGRRLNGYFKRRWDRKCFLTAAC